MKELSWTKGCGLLIVLLIARKFFIGLLAMQTVRSCEGEVAFERIVVSEDFQRVISERALRRDNLVLILNQHALNMTFNWLCNTQGMAGVHESTLVVTLDDVAAKAMSEAFPHIRVFNWRVKCLKDPFNYGDGFYQLFYLFRANLARAFIDGNISFWMIQQDTFWGTSLLELNFTKEEREDIESADLVFDSAAENGGPLIAGGYYRVRPSAASREYFSRLASDLRWRYVPDNTHMTAICETAGLARCARIPFRMITNWIWLHEPSRRAANGDLPALVQFDGDTKLGGKLAKMRRLGFYFLDDGDSPRTCNASRVERVPFLLREAAERAETGTSYSHLQFGFYQALIDQMNRFRITELFLNYVVYPNAHYFMITI